MQRTQFGYVDLGSVIVVPVDRATKRIALVFDPAKPEPQCWKFPGGGIELNDAHPDNPLSKTARALRAAKREAKEETGLNIRIEKLLLQRTKGSHAERGPHTVYVYLGSCDFDALIRRGNDGEYVQKFSLDQIYALKNFFEPHREFLQMAIPHIS